MARRTLLLSSLLLLGILAWAARECATHSDESSSAPPAVASEIESALPDQPLPERLEVEQPDATGSAPTSVEWRVICQEFRSTGARTPLAGVELRIQPTADEDAPTSGPILGPTDASGAAVLPIPLGVPFALIGEWGGSRARRPFHSLALEELQDLFPDGIELDFFLEPATIFYEITGGPPDFDATWFLTVGASPIPRLVAPRNDEVTDPISLPLRTPPQRGEFRVEAGAPIHWAILDSRGQPRAVGDSGRALMPGESWHLAIRLDEAAFPPLRHFKVVEGLEHVQAQWESSLRLVHFDAAGTRLGEDSASVAPSGEASIPLDDTGEERILVTCGTLRPQWLTVGPSDGLDRDQPIPLRFAAATRVFVHRADHPDLGRARFKLILRSGGWLDGFVREVDDSPERLELVAGWGAEVQSVLFADRLHLVTLERETEAWLPSPQIQPVPHAAARGCTLHVELARPQQATAEVEFRVRGEVWQRLNVTARGSRMLQLTLALPDEPGEVRMREGRGTTARLDYVPVGGIVKLFWDNR